MSDGSTLGERISFQVRMFGHTWSNEAREAVRIIAEAVAESEKLQNDLLKEAMQRPTTYTHFKGTYEDGFEAGVRAALELKK